MKSVRLPILAALAAAPVLLAHAQPQTPAEKPTQTQTQSPQPPSEANPPRQTPPPSQQTPPVQGPMPPTAGRGGRGGGRGQGPGTFPAQQRVLAEAAVIERGRSIYSVTCSSCHGADLRGGQLGGPNLLRSQVMLNDQHGELLLPIVRGSRADKGMPPLPIPDDDVVAIAEYIHSVHASAGRQGSPPPSDGPPPNIVVGDAAAGQAYFAATCSKCHSATGDLRGIATRVADPKALQNLWVSGGLVAGRGARGGGGASPRRPITATVTLPTGEKLSGRLLRLDHFIVTIVTEDGSIRSVRREGDQPAVVINDPVAPHRELLAKYTDKNVHDVTAYLVTLK